MVAQPPGIYQHHSAMAPEKKEDRIDLKNLKQRELLIVVATNQRKLEDQVDRLEQSVNSLTLEVNTLKTKNSMSSRIWGGIMGIGTAILTIVLERMLT